MAFELLEIGAKFISPYGRTVSVVDFDRNYVRIRFPDGSTDEYEPNDFLRTFELAD